MFREDGYMDAWDMLYQQAAPVLSSKVTQISNHKINKYRSVHELRSSSNARLACFSGTFDSILFEAVTASAKDL